MNYISKFVKLYPIDYKIIDELEIIEICKEIKKDFPTWGPCIYEWNNEDNTIELLYVSKKHSPYFVDGSVLKYFHYWERQGDEGNFKDIIKGESLTYKTENG